MNYIFCPKCPPVFHRNIPEKRVGTQMECTERSYSGTGTDIFVCPKCGKDFFVSYKVDTIIPVEEE